jgi:hypothetical protein
LVSFGASSAVIAANASFAASSLVSPISHKSRSAPSSRPHR